MAGTSSDISPERWDTVVARQLVGLVLQVGVRGWMNDESSLVSRGWGLNVTGGNVFPCADSNTLKNITLNTDSITFTESWQR